jgi:hypothetical protein
MSMHCEPCRPQAYIGGAERVKKSFGDPLPSFRWTPESSLFSTLQRAGTQVFTGVTTESQFFHSFAPSSILPCWVANVGASRGEQSAAEGDFRYVRPAD